MDALDPADDMLSIAIAKNIYGRIIHDCMDGHRTDIKDGKYSITFTRSYVYTGSSLLRVTTCINVSNNRNVFEVSRYCACAAHTAARVLYEICAV